VQPINLNHRRNNFKIKLVIIQKMILYTVILLIHHYMKRKGIPTDYFKAT
jgi:hypothetical protein